MTIAERKAIAAQAVDWLLDAIQNYIWADATRKDVETVIEVIDHKHCPEDANEWALSRFGQAVRNHINKGKTDV